MKKNAELMNAVLRWRRCGLTLRQSAAVAGIHAATVCRWQKQDPQFRQALAEAATEGRHRLRPEKERPRVRWHRDCPLCQARVVVRTARGGGRFWRCGRWPWCSWASWRPRCPRNCRTCGGPRLWSHSRRSVVCTACGLRTHRP